jgi:beta-mannosidase
MSRRDYDRLFKKLLGDVVRKEAADICYWQASPHTPLGNGDVHNADSGDAHLWGVWHGRQPFEWYRACQHRFISEFGYQSFPEPKTVNTFADPEDRNITSYVMEQHQRSPIGNSVMIGQMGEWFLLPKDFESTLWLSQIQQGIAMKIACEHWRRNMPRTMGTLFWQFNDCWPVASWSAIDSLGRKKALYYMTRDFFAPVLLSAVEDPKSGIVELHVSNDLRQACAGKLSWSVTTAQGKALRKGSLACKAAAGSSKRVMVLKLKDLIERHTSRDLLVWLKLESRGKILSENLVTFARPKHLLLGDPKLRINATARGDGFLVTIKATLPALYVWLHLEGCDASFSGNFQPIAGGSTLEVEVMPKRQLGLAAFKRALHVEHLGSTHL